MRQLKQFFLPNIIDSLDEFYVCGDQCQEYCKPQNLSISEDGEKIYIDAPLPGVKSEDVEVTFDPQTKHLTIRGKNVVKRENVTYHLEGQSTFHYEIPVSQDIDLDASIQAACKNGILSVELSKHKQNKPVKIDVRSV